MTENERRWAEYWIHTLRQRAADLNGFMGTITTASRDMAGAASFIEDLIERRAETSHKRHK